MLPLGAYPVPRCRAPIETSIFRTRRPPFRQSQPAGFASILQLWCRDTPALAGGSWHLHMAPPMNFTTATTLNAKANAAVDKLYVRGLLLASRRYVTEALGPNDGQLCDATSVVFALPSVTG